MTQVFLLGLSAAATWPDPGNWNPAANTVECVGGGRGGTTGPAAPTSSIGGGGGGAYAIGHNLALTFPVSYFCMGDSVSNADGQATNFNSSASGPITTPGCVSAAGGTSGPAASNGAAGAGGQLFYPAGFAGGSGGTGYANGSTAVLGGGGGGAAGPHGAGSVGGSNGATIGGNADGGTVLGPTAVSAPGNPGTQWDASHGCGSGSAPSTGDARNITGGYYGGGAAGGNNNSVSGSVRYGGKGQRGLIVITYTPFVPPAGGLAMIMA